MADTSDHEDVLWIVQKRNKLGLTIKSWVFRSRRKARAFKNKKNRTSAFQHKVVQAEWGPDNVD